MKFYLGCFCFLLFYSCKTIPSPGYLKGNKNDTSFSQVNLPPLIQNGDQLIIRIQSINKEASAIYNIEDAAPSSNSGVPVFTVDNNGNILLPQLGIVKAADLSIIQLREQLLNRVDKFLSSAFVSISFAGCHVSVLGEVNKPGTIAMPSCSLSVIEAIAEAGDLKEAGDKKSISLIRKADAVVTTVNLDVTKLTFIQSPYYFLKRDDVLIVNTDPAKLKKTKDGLSRTISIASAFLSTMSALLIIVLNLSKK